MYICQQDHSWSWVSISKVPGTAAQTNQQDNMFCGPEKSVRCLWFSDKNFMCGLIKLAESLECHRQCEKEISRSLQVHVPCSSLFFVLPAKHSGTYGSLCPASVCLSVCPVGTLFLEVKSIAMFRRWHLHSSECCHYVHISNTWCMYEVIFVLYSELTQIIGDVIADPTLPRTEEHPCPKCTHKESVFFQSHSSKAEVGYRAPRVETCIQYRILYVYLV